MLDECNGSRQWAHLLSSTKWKGVECRAYSFGSNLLEGMAVVRQADGWISLHGSGETNSFFLRPDTLKIELRAKEFGTTHRCVWYLKEDIIIVNLGTILDWMAVTIFMILIAVSWTDTTAGSSLLTGLGYARSHNFPSSAGS